jgi:hypothetical protein
MGNAALWVYKNNAKGHGYQTATGDWDSFFAESGDGTWGGVATMGRTSRKLMDEMRRGDLVLAWQSDRRRAIGVLRFDGLAHSTDGARMRFTPLARFTTPVPLLELRDAVDGLADINAFKSGFPQTLYRTSQSEARLILDVCGYNRAKGSRRGDEGSDPVDEVYAAAAAGFGDAETNRKVERAAVRAVTADYKTKGWHVESVEADRCGYDLVCRRARKAEHVEVKGVNSSRVEFILTEGERRKAESDSLFVLVVVTDALTAPRLRRFVGRSILDRMALVPISWKLTL